MSACQTLSLIDDLLKKVDGSKSESIDECKDTQDKSMEFKKDEVEEKLLSQTLNAKSKIYVTNSNDIKKELLAKQSESGITAKLRLTNKSLTIYYPQPILFDSSATQKSKGSRLATDMNLKTMEDEIIFTTRLSNIASRKILIENKADNVTIISKDSSQCVLTLSKWSAKSLNESLAKLIDVQ